MYTEFIHKNKTEKATTEREPEVLNNLNLLNKHIGDLDELINSLIVRLQPVKRQEIKPPTEDENKAENKKETESSCETAYALYQLIKTICNIKERIKENINLLEI